MSKNIFDATLDPNNDVKVNNFDWSHANNLTTQIGRVTPIFCDLVPAKTSFRVNPRFGLQFMPMVFPIQTRMKARISWYRYPVRALWKDYKDFVGNFREGLEEPYINFNTETRLKKMASTGSLGDYLGLPTTVFGKYGSLSSVAVDASKSQLVMKGNTLGSSSTCLSTLPLSDDSLTYMETNSQFSYKSDAVNAHLSAPGTASVDTNETLAYRFEYEYSPGSPTFSRKGDYIDLKFNVAMAKPTLLPVLRSCMFTLTQIKPTLTERVQITNYEVGLSSDAGITLTLRLYLPDGFDFPDSAERSYTIGIYFPLFSSLCRYIDGDNTRWEYTKTGGMQKAFGSNFPNSPIVGSQSGDVDVAPLGFGSNTFYAMLSKASVVFANNATKPEDIRLSTSPWYNSNSENKDKQQKILAYGFRAYEGIYNAYIRDNRNNPYYLNGEVQYNKWIPSDEGGEDNNLYELRYANWEKDFLTTAVQSPQQGNAPLVGITTYAQTVANEDGTTTELVKTALVDEDGKKYGLSFKTSEEGLEGVEYIELDNGTQVRQARSLYDLATSGISIPDLRMVNCYQKFLELNMRKGYSYKDIVEGRFDVKVRYADLLMPEFFGGVSRDIDVNSVTQTVDNNAATGSGDYATALGSQSGIAGVRGEANANIECFCDEESIIMGILIVTPLPVYTQLLPKHFTYRGLMDHYQPEFNLIGFQPIKYNEVCPIQAYNDNPNSLTETFGYNRPWYEYAQKYDVAHGLFRTDLSNFLMHRVFNQKPELAQSFLLVDPEQVTDVFAVTETTDKIYGQIWLDITCKLPIARVAIPRLD